MMPDLRFADHAAHARAFFDAAVAAADPARALESNWPYALTQVRGPIYVVGAGKAALEMALKLEDLLPVPITGGAVAVVPERLDKLKEKPRNFAVYPVGHPVADLRNVRASRAIAEVAALAGKDDTLIALFSGGGSVHLTLPVEELSLDDLKQITEALNHSGATVAELNIVRRHLERLKGGKLAKLAHPAVVWSFILSDIVGDSLPAIASGPTATDPSTFSDALAVLDRYSVRDAVPAVTRYLEEGVQGKHLETLQPEDKLTHVYNMLIGSNRRALDAVRRHAKSLGWNVVGFEFSVEGEARIAGMNAGILAHSLVGRPDLPCLWLQGGEMTVTVHGEGKGGPSQEIALAAATVIDGLPNVAVAAFSTDGADGPTDAAGAVVNGATMSKLRELGLDVDRALADNDTYTALDRVGALIRTGPTGTNVNDVIAVMVYDSA